ncbi:flavin reductase (DIM6/NTAB) family NADH-FMN oxidoreductase RutF [Stackebrandtia albiflava]|uniref:Flavin reductase (DIM6/NTAB) family NADH-FMN oxidoreductase RutF n=1 Tax=Stackebrandtia albiflava TaxID=406432 RepID=A0A562V271_9ACTN|nr:flavin reductase family protein [Stackebrandtia albiflava]TWJ11935.1 flavin reductase (DIM6/NTAB) family NADH-FMN oxidoreductase RutF [Stackebrandtia albiflava]
MRNEHRRIDLKVLYFGTPVILLSTENPDGTTNLAPMSSAWWLGDTAVIGMGNRSQTAVNLHRTRRCVLNLVPSGLVAAVDRLAMTTGRSPVPDTKSAQGYRHVHDKFTAAGLTPRPSTEVAAAAVAECPILLETALVAAHSLSGPGATAFELRVLAAHADPDLVIPGTRHIDPVAWDPLIMKFTEYFGGGTSLHASRLSESWRMPHRLTGDHAGSPGLTSPVS